MTIADYVGKVWNVDAIQFMRDCLPANSIDFIFTDPPYGHNNNNGDLISRREAALGKGDYVPERDNRAIHNDGQEANDLIRAAFAEFNRILKPGACCCCCGGGGGPDPQFARWSLWMDDAIGFKMCVVWDKGGLGMGWHYRRNWECVLVAQKKGAACKWYGGNDVANVIRFPKIIPSKEQHPCEKPIQLPSHFIQLHTQPGDIVFDPFMGSGTTAVACEKLGRRWLGCEVDPQWLLMAEKKIARESEKVKLFV